MSEAKLEKKKSKENLPTTIKSPTAKKPEKRESTVENKTQAGRKQAPGGKGNDNSSGSGSGKGGRPARKGLETKSKKPVKEKKGKKKGKKSCMQKLFRSFGIGVGVIKLSDPRAIESAQALDLRQSHLRQLRMKFDEIDIDGSGQIDAEEFFEAVGEHRSPFTDKLFQFIDLDGSGTIEFDEYIRVLSTYCMFSKDEILRFCFDCFDVDGSGTIDEKEFVELCKTVNNAAPSFPGNFKKALEEFDVNEDGLIDYAEFLELDRRYPIILFPAYRLQDTLQRNSLGEKGWVKVIESYNKIKRIEEYKAANGGRLPPDPPLVALGKILLPCFFQQKAGVKVGADLNKDAKKK